MKSEYDIVIIGSGLAGSMVGLVLGKIGCRTLVVEKNQHPRFAVGESTVPATNIILNFLAEKYGIPEFRTISHYLELKKENLTGHPKAHVWYGFHEAGKPVRQQHEIMFEGLPLPLGPDTHLMRSEVDEFLVKRLSRYGVDYTDHTSLVDMTYIPDSRRVELMLERETVSKVTAKLVIDASGHQSFLGKKYGLLDDPDKLHTRTRTLFGQFRKVGEIDKILGYNPAFRFRRGGGTMHHCFDGGWMWEIPFDNGISSVGMILDIDKSPLNPEISPEAELREKMDRFPTIGKLLASAEPIRPLTRTGRVQFHSSRTCGDGFVQTPHASAFIDPLFSSGIVFTMGFVARIIPIIQNAMRDDDFSKERFLPLQHSFRKEVDFVDLMVSGCIRSFSNFATLKPFIFTQSFSYLFHYFLSATGNLQDPNGTTLIMGASIPAWQQHLKNMHEVMFDSGLSPEAAGAKLLELCRKLPKAFNNAGPEPLSDRSTLFTVSYPSTGFFRFCYDMLIREGQSRSDVDWQRFLAFGAATQVKWVKMRAEYSFSRLAGSRYYKDVDRLKVLTQAPQYQGFDDFFASFTDPWHARYLKS